MIQINDHIIQSIGNIADNYNIQAYLVGGYVRDYLLGKTVKDTDIMVIYNGVEFAKIIAKELNLKNIVVFENFGTSMLTIENRKIEFVGARKESYNTNSRNPLVQIGTLEDDLIRRDFTINAMALSINKNSYGQLIDLFNGQSDLQNKILRTPLNAEETFNDDPLRIMRAFRFASQLNFSIDQNIFTSANKLSERLKIVSQERITDEFLKIILSPKPSIGLKFLYDSNVMQIIFPELALLGGVEQINDYHHKDVFLHTLQVLDKIAESSDNLYLRLTALLHDIAKPKTKKFVPNIGWTFHGHEEIGARMVKKIFQKMRFPMENISYVEKLIRLHLRPQALVDDGVTDSAVRRLLFEAGNDIDDLMTLCRADITSKNQKLIEQVNNNYELVVQKMVEVEQKDKLRNWQPPLSGTEIMQICNITEGPMVGVLKDKITDAILDGLIENNYNAALTFLNSIKEETLSKPPIKKKRK